MTTEQRRLAAIVSADVAGYSRLMGKDEGGTLAALKALRQEVVDPAIRGDSSQRTGSRQRIFWVAVMIGRLSLSRSKPSASDCGPP
jgi:hypothetical protein